MVFRKKPDGLSNEARAAMAAAALNVLQKQIRTRSMLMRQAEAGPGWEETEERADRSDGYLNSALEPKAS